MLALNFVRVLGFGPQCLMVHLYTRRQVADMERRQEVIERLDFKYGSSGDAVKVFLRTFLDSFLLELTATYSLTLRVFQEMCDLGLFLFSDTLVLTRRQVQHKPFSLARLETHTFLASVALSCLSARELTHTRCESTQIHTHRRTRTHVQRELEVCLSLQM